MTRATTRSQLFRSLCCAALFVLIATTGLTQIHTNPESLVMQPIDEAVSVTLKGNVLPLFESSLDRGPAPGAMTARRLMLLLRRSPGQEVELQSYLQSVQDTKSPNFRKFLSPAEFGKRYGLSDTDLAKIQGWLQNHGFSAIQVNRGRTAIEFSGTVGQLEQTFHISIHKFLSGGVEHWANIAEPQIPAALAQAIGGVASLNDLKPQPHLIKGAAGRWNTSLRRFTPDLTAAINGDNYLFVGPGDAATIYDTPNSLNAHLAAGQTPYDGTGVTIGIAGTTLLDDLGPTFYRDLFGLPESSTHTLVYDGDESNLNYDSDETEAILDNEVAGGLAPNANVIYYAAGDTAFQSGLFLAIYRAIDDNNVDILNVSYGQCEALLGSAGNLQVLNAWEQAAAQGITVVVSTGDAGSAGCDNPNTETAATHGLAVNGLASTPYNIAAGGSDFDILSKKFSTYVSSTDVTNYTSALSYIPENPWNNSTSANGLLAANSVYTNSSGLTNIVSGGGGASSLGNEGQSGYPKPLWQQGFTPSNTDTVRDVPDVSLLAGNGQYGALWALCIDSDCSSGANSTIHGVGGTSASAPALAGILALVNQKVGARLGQANWVLYKLAQTNPNAFHSITSGNNSVPCSSSSPNCGSNGFLTGYNSGASYNLATGLGSLDATNLVNDWGSDSLTPTNTTLTLDKTSFVHGASVTLSSGVKPAAATGYVAIVSNYAAQAQATTSAPTSRILLSGGSASESYSQLPGGTYNVYASYGGDGSYAGSTSQPVQVIVSPEDSVLQFSVSTVNSSSQLVNAAGSTVPLGTFLTLNAQPIGSSQVGKTIPVTNATGNVVFIDSLVGGLASNFGSVPLDSTGNAEVNATYLNAGAHAIAASYSGDLSYNPSAASAISFTVSQGSTTIATTASANTTIGSSLTVQALIATSVPYGAFNATGSVTFTDATSNMVLGSAPAGAASQCVPATTACFSAILTVNATQLATGANWHARCFAPVRLLV